MHNSRTLAVASWLWPISLAENLARIACWDLPIAQVALLFYQTAPSLAYTDRDLAAHPGLTAHVHLPLDLPWRHGPEAVFAVIQALMDKAGPLRPWAGVLHPPADAAVLADLAALWRETRPPWRLLLENVPGQDLADHWPTIRDLDIPLCLDVGHMMAFGQDWLLADPEALARVEMVHCYAPGVLPDRHEHLALDRLSAAQAATVRRVLAAVPERAVIVFEVFSESDLRASLQAFYALSGKHGS